jgi:hypothetical protein
VLRVEGLGFRGCERGTDSGDGDDGEVEGIVVVEAGLPPYVEQL